MLETMRSAWKIKELRQRIIFVLLMLVVYRLGAHIPVPGVDPTLIADMFQGDNLFGLFNVFAGGALEQFTVFAMGIMPYINASIIMQLLTVVIPKLEQLAKEGPEGQKVMQQYVRFGTIGLAFIQATGMTVGIFRGAVVDPNWFTYLTIIITLTAGTAFLMWLGELINERGIGNGISIIIFAGIVSQFGPGLTELVTFLQIGEINIFTVIATILIILALIVGIIALEEGQRRIPVQYAKRVVGRKMYGGQSTHIPMKVNQSGVIPVIFASALLMFPATVAQFIDTPFFRGVAAAFAPGAWLHTILYVLLILFFAYFYTAIQFDPMKISNDMKKNGGFIPGLRPGRPTAEFLARVSTRLTLAGAIALAFIATVPVILQIVFNINVIFGGVGMIIVVGVVLETMKQIESQMMMRNYQGFMK
ncbi:preprotein translocase subunit SecY [Dethiobacter alkaliphilus]|uniref:Protein translocase subunit SecY n=1 Tax=Dethiobacter alkaliphilus AHT 1 TaxID=555088 RepID=C0GG94_DETAL|nr:preprotein translocase subunit SecY [Dethiobacter alkaliphilus]EEG77783.1 preprotein translocase, SecY subunit [Dethiobacter alkaliphilus AHT 1]